MDQLQNLILENSESKDNLFLPKYEEDLRECIYDI